MAPCDRRTACAAQTVALFAATILLTQENAHAIRPFVTDDARVVGAGRAQLETYLQIDQAGGHHWILPAIGPTDWLELTVGALHGVGADDSRAYSVTAPLLQAKALLRPTAPGEPPGVAVAVGSLLPFGRGLLLSDVLGAFAYLAATQSLIAEDVLLFHLNVGGALRDNDGRRVTATAGLGAQAHVIAGLYALGEIFYGDAYTGARDVAGQIGIRYAFSETIQIDTAAGWAFAGPDRRFAWISVGIRIVSNPFW